jgi:hypothetical protein
MIANVTLLKIGGTLQNAKAIDAKNEKYDF